MAGSVTRPLLFVRTLDGYSLFSRAGFKATSKPNFPHRIEIVGLCGNLFIAPSRKRYNFKMEPAKENRLRAWLSPVLKQYGQWLERTPDGAEHFKQYGRWSRWDKHGLLEANVNLEGLALRVRSKLNEPKPARSINLAELARDRSGEWGASW